MKTLLLYITALLLAVGTAKAQTSSANFLTEETSAKSFSMGSAFTACSDSADSLNINPAALGYLSMPDVSAGYKKNLAGGFNSSVFCALPLKADGVLGAGITMYDLGSVDINYLDGTSETVNAMQSWTANVGYGYNIRDELAVGLNLKYIKSTLAGRFTGTAFAADLGVLFKTTDSAFSWGFAMQNLGTQIVYVSDGDSLPFTLRTGIAYKLREGTFDSWLITTDALYYDGKLRYNAGLECSLYNIISLRAGYKLGYTPDVLSFGAGFDVSGINIDYAYSMLGSMDSMQMMTVSFKFGELSIFDTAKAFYDKGLTERALPMFKSIKKDNPAYAASVKFAKSIEKEKQAKKLEKQAIMSVTKELSGTGAEELSDTGDKTAVMDLEPKNVSKASAASASGMLRRYLKDCGNFSVIESESVDRKLAGWKYQKAACADIERAVAVGMILNVKMMVVGTIVKTGDKYAVCASLVDVGTGKVKATAEEAYHNEDDLAYACRAAANKLGGK